jgi:hypothetical protein
MSGGLPFRTIVATAGVGPQAEQLGYRPRLASKEERGKHCRANRDELEPGSPQADFKGLSGRKPQLTRASSGQA